jgi:hypothetical protein
MVLGRSTCPDSCVHWILKVLPQRTAQQALSVLAFYDHTPFLVAHQNVYSS